MTHMRSVRVAVIAGLVSFALGLVAVWVGYPPRIVVAWETASEVDTAGFHVFRGRSREGPFVRISEVPVPAAGDPLVGASYRYVDRNVAWGDVYYYQLEELELTGRRNRLSAVVRARAGAGWPWALGAGAASGTLGASAAVAVVSARRRAAAGAEGR